MYSPDEEANIRAEMNRDAMPSPEEAAEMNRRALAEEGCGECGEDAPDELDRYGLHLASCRALQVPDAPFVVLCEEHADERETVRERALRRARERNEQEWHDRTVIGVEFYACQNSSYIFEGSPPTITEDVQVGWTDDGEAITEEQELELPGPPSTTLGTECRCGKPLVDVVLLNEESD